ncbi:cation efflux system protein [Fulvitalea axinellae]|uniref:Cation efflux system protein n=1 Tax=Fulvitalea axinellae TaxID=1182444 RepID=A0AAU9CVL4_9BACT|nr:cation efflux system protein [Fulvitalea axinellae]
MDKRKLLRLLFFFFVMSGGAYAQNSLRVRVVRDGSGSDKYIDSLIRHETQELMRYRGGVEMSFEKAGTGLDEAERVLRKAFADPSTDLVVASGVMGSIAMERIGELPKPGIAALVLSSEFQGFPKTEKGTSGRKNFAYIGSPFRFGRDLEKLRGIKEFKHLAIIVDQGPQTRLDKLATKYFETLAKCPVSIVPISGDPEKDLALIPESVDAVYYTHVEGYAPHSRNLRVFFDKLHTQGRPVYAMLGKDYVESGALASMSNDNETVALARRIALDIMKISEGVKPSDLPIDLEVFGEDLYYNLDASAKLGLVPGWDVVAGAILTRSEEAEATGENLDLKSAIVRALGENLGLKAKQYDNNIAEQEVGLAKAKLLPQVEAGLTAVKIDKDRAESSFGSSSEHTVNLTGKLSQVVFSEPAFANVTIQRMLAEAERQGVKTAELDLVLEISEAYLQLLQAKSIVEIREDNLLVTKTNLDVSRAKHNVGQGSPSDVYRLEAQLSQNKNELFDAKLTAEKASLLLKQLLNLPQEAEIHTRELGIGDNPLDINGEELTALVSENHLSRRLATFLVREANANLPEIKQLVASIEAQERLRKSQNRKLFTPSLGLSGETGKPLYRSELPGVEELNKDLTWNIGLGLNMPIYGGGQNRKELRKTKLSIEQLQYQEKDLRNQLEMRVRINLASVRASLLKVAQSAIAQDKAAKSLEILQDYYRQGLVDLVKLLDGQNAALQTEIATSNATYALTLDFLALGRSIGRYEFLDTPEQRKEFYTRVMEYLLSEN